jgi:hypothetical protein
MARSDGSRHRTIGMRTASDNAIGSTCSQPRPLTDPVSHTVARWTSVIRAVVSR